MKQPPSSDVIWDWPTRIIHWVIAVGVILNLFVLEEGDPPHEWVGYIAVGFVVLRAIWGFVGSGSSRFSAFPFRPLQIKEFLTRQFSPAPPDYPGHNPVASWVYFGVWLHIIALAVTGWMMGLDAYWGEEWLEDLHGTISTTLQILIVLHLVGIAIDSVKFKRKTWLGMILGRRNF